MTPSPTNSAITAADFPALRALAEILGATAPLEVKEAGDEESVTVYRCPICDGEGSVAADEVLTMNASPHDFPIGDVGIQCFGIGDGHGNLERALRNAPKEITEALARLAEVEDLDQRCRNSVVECMVRFSNVHEYVAQLERERDSAKARALEAWQDADAAIEKEVERQVASIMGDPDNEIARQKASKEVFRNERDALQIECGKLRAQLAHARSRGDDKEIAEKQRDSALTRAEQSEALLRESRPLVCSIAADDRNEHWQQAADVTKRITAHLAPKETT